MKPSLSLAVALVLALATLWPATPAQAETTYTVAPGDTLWAISVRHGTTVAELVAANNIANPNLIFVGQRLVIPGESPVAAPPPPSPTPAPPAPPEPTPTPAPPRGAPEPGSTLAEQVLLTYYGNPYSSLMGILGELGQAELVAALQRKAAEYQAVSARPVRPAIHFVATVAQAGPGADGLYRARMPFSVVEEYANLAADHDLLFILDLQFGRSTVQQELAPWLPLLRQPHVHLALDPEFNMWGSQVPGQALGHMTAAEINYAIDYLAAIVEEHELPNKVLMLYQFTPTMLPDKHNIELDPRVDVVINMDGFGSKALKIRHYDIFVGQHAVQYAGIKLFYQYDPDLMTPAEVMALDPTPDVIVYQ